MTLTLKKEIITPITAVGRGMMFTWILLRHMRKFRRGNYIGKLVLEETEEKVITPKESRNNFFKLGNSIKLGQYADKTDSLYNRSHHNFALFLMCHLAVTQNLKPCINDVFFTYFYRNTILITDNNKLSVIKLF